jgi:Skp family chaperone for outer membrane proteins
VGRVARLASISKRSAPSETRQPSLAQAARQAAAALTADECRQAAQTLAHLAREAEAERSRRQRDLAEQQRDFERKRRELLEDLNRTRNITIVLVTHEEDIAAYAKRQIRFKDGKIASDVFTHPAAAT